MNEFNLLCQCSPDQLPPLAERTIPPRSAARIREQIRRRIRVPAASAPRRRMRPGPMLILAALITAVAALSAAAMASPIGDAIGDAVRRTFSRFLDTQPAPGEDSVLAPYSTDIGQSVQVGGVQLKAERAFRDDRLLYIECTLSYPTVEADFIQPLSIRLTAESETVSRYGRKKKTAEVLLSERSVPSYETAILAGDLLHLVPGETSGGFRFYVTAPLSGLPLDTNRLKLEITGLAAIVWEDEMESTKLCDSLSLPFALDELEEEIPVLEFAADRTFTLDGCTYRLDAVRATPMELVLSVTFDTAITESPIEGLEWRPSMALNGHGRFGELRQENPEWIDLLPPYLYRFRLDLAGGGGEPVTLCSVNRYFKRWPDTDYMEVIFTFDEPIDLRAIREVWVECEDALYFGGQSKRCTVWEPYQSPLGELLPPLAG